MIKAIFKTYLDNHKEIRYIIRNLRGKGIVRNYFHTTFNKNALMMYTTAPFISNINENIHQAYWQQIEIAKILSTRGYNIDVIDYDNSTALLFKKYDLVLDLIPGRNPVFRKHMKNGCLTIAYLTGSNANFQNEAELKRICDLKIRRGFSLIPRRQSPILTKEIENYSACFMIGNEYNWKTYSEFNLRRPYFIKNTGYQMDFYFNRNIKDKRCFLYFGSHGQVHKGLDLLLDIFSENEFPCELYVCGTFQQEIDFNKAYSHELYECKNIHSFGFVDIESDEFKKIVARCVYSIMPSCSEGISGSVLTTMSAGLIPICSRECGMGEDEVFHLPDCSINSIRKMIIDFSNKDLDWIYNESKKTYQIINERYSYKDFIRSFNCALDDTLIQCKD